MIYASVSALVASTEGARGVGSLWLAGTLAYTEAATAATDQHLTTAGSVKLYSAEPAEFGTWNPYADGTIAENPDSGAVFTDYTTGGTGDGDLLNTAIIAAIGDNLGRLHVPAGQYLIDASTIIGGGLGNAARGFTLAGDGRSSSSHIQYGFGRQGSSLIYEAGETISGFRQGIAIEDLSIYGQINGTFMNYGSGLVDGGGLRRFTISNNAVSASYAAAVGVQVTAFYTTDFNEGLIIGRRDYRPARTDDSIDTPDLYFGTGLFCDTTGQGGIGTVRSITISGWDTGLLIEADAVSATKRIAPTRFQEPQFSFCRCGARFAQGVEEITLETPFFEYNSDHHLKFHDGAGYLYINGGRNTGTTRQYDSGGGAVTHRMLDAAFVFGDAVSADCAWDGAWIKQHSFSGMANSNAGVLLYAGTGAGFVVLEDCIFTGGAAVILDLTNVADGVPDVWIKNGHQETTQGTYPHASRWICTFTRGTDYSLHTYADANWYGRVDGQVVVIGAGAASTGAVDFTGRRFIPYAISPALGVDLTITIDSTTWTGQFMIVNKLYSSGKVDIVIPAGSVLYDRTNTRTAGAATHAVSATGSADRFTLRKLTATEWVVE